MGILNEWSQEPKENKERLTIVNSVQHHEYSLEEIAEELGITRGTVKTYLERAYEKVRRHKELKEWL